jgi:hypothetical protein
MIRRIVIWLVSGLLCTVACGVCRADDVSSTGPSNGPAQSAKTGKLDLAFTDRSPLSSPQSLAQRLNLKQSELGPDYDLSKRPFKAFVPTNYDPATPCGVIVYLGYKDSVSVPPRWLPMLEKAHLIFITPVCHTGNQYPPSVPEWQTVGLALDAIYNLKKQYRVDDRRIYQISWTIRPQIATADIFTGFINVNDLGYYKRITLEGRSYLEPTIKPPAANEVERAKDRPWMLAIINDEEHMQPETARMKAMRGDGYSHVDMIPTTMDDTHYPNLTVEWFEEKALPFLDKTSGNSVEPQRPISEEASSTPTTRPAAEDESNPAPTTHPVEAASEPSAPQHLLSIAQMLINNGNKDLARQKLQEIIDTYPGDPAAAKAKQLLDGMDGQ